MNPAVRPDRTSLCVLVIGMYGGSYIHRAMMLCLCCWIEVERMINDEDGDDNDEKSKSAEEVEMDVGI